MTNTETRNTVDTWREPIPGNLRQPMIVTAIFFGIILSILLAILAFVVGGFAFGGLIFELNPTYWCDTIYGIDPVKDPDMVGKARAQTRIQVGFWLAFPSFFVGLLTPWLFLRYIKPKITARTEN